ncbi:MAG: DUF1592 domain-containing protein [Planctomycetes bacterium]|nr:DUF1592 domain-containing protein [Planctomycetota bacterium]
MPNTVPIAFSFLALWLGLAPIDVVGGDAFAEFLQPAFAQSCVKCHGKGPKVKGKVNLFELKSVSDLAEKPELLSKLIEALDSEEMPPEKEPALAPEKRQRLVAELKEILRLSVDSQESLARTPIRRMNRFQYNNAVKDLFRLKVEVFPLPEKMMRDHGYFKPETGKMAPTVKVGSRPLGKSQLIEPRLAGVAPFPQDLRAEHGFDNRGDHLSLSPLLMESFLKLSRSIVNSRDFNSKRCGIWKTFFAGPKKAARAAVKERLRGFLVRAFRRPPDDSTLKRYTAYVHAQLDAGKPFTAAMRAGAAGVICSPRFLYLRERNEKVGDDYELASRLSFFLWGSIPDKTLLELAAAGKLHQPEILRLQVDRMLKDRRLKRFCDSFPSQWLQLDRIISVIPERENNQDFFFGAYRASMHMMLEPLLLFETVLIEDRPITELLAADFSYRSALLEKWYKEGGPAGGPPTAIPFKRVPVTDRRQGGVITNAAVMTMTSSSTRTKPITRGAWLATVIFNNPPEPPPANVPELSEKPAKKDEGLTIRERLAVHRERPDCAGCHAKLDPLGFALENYGPTGLWRDKYSNGRVVDPGGTLLRKHEFKNIVEFKDALLAEKVRFTRAFAGHLLSFAVGRGLVATDSPALDRIAAATIEKGYRMKALVHEIALSEPFLQNSEKKAAK